MKNQILAILCAVVILLSLGIAALASASVTSEVPERFYSHLKWLAVGVAACAGAAWMNYEWLRWRRLPEWLFWFSVLLLVLVLIPGIGWYANGARRWFVCGGQPSELMKLAMVIFLADWACRHGQRMDQPGKGFFQPGLCLLLVAGLIMAEPDYGTTFLVLTVSAAVLLFGGARWLYWLPTSLAGGGVGFWLIRINPERWERFVAFRNPELYLDGAGWQGWNSMLAIARGKLWPVLFGNGTHKYGFVPEQQTDFIFSLIAEELGFGGGLLVVGMFGIILLAGTSISGRTSDPFARLLGAGLTLMIVLQACINLGVATSVLPNKGIPLPLVSYGGSSIVIMLVCVGLLISIAWHAPRLPVYPKPVFASRPANPFGADAEAAETSRTLGERLFGWLRAAHSAPRRLRSYQLPPGELPKRQLTKSNPFKVISLE